MALRQCTMCGKSKDDDLDFSYQHKCPYGLLDMCDMCWRSERARAWAAYRKARRYGLIYPPHACEDCGRCDKPLTGHHLDYRHPLTVRWVCTTPCHARAHRADEERWADGKGGHSPRGAGQGPVAVAQSG